MRESAETRTRPGLIVFGIIIAVVLLAAIFWVRRSPPGLPAEELINELKSGTTTQRAIAAEGLAKIGSSAAVDPLIAAMKDKEWTVRRAAASALGDLKDGRALPALIEAVDDENAWVRVAAATGLGKMNDPSAIPAIEKMVKQEKAKPEKERNEDVVSFGEAALQQLKSK